MGSLGRSVVEDSPYPFSAISPEIRHKQSRPLQVSVITPPIVFNDHVVGSVNVESTPVFPGCVDAFCEDCRPVPPQSLSLHTRTTTESHMGSERNASDADFVSPVCTEATIEQSTSANVVRTPITRLAPMRFDFNQNPTGKENGIDLDGAYSRTRPKYERMHSGRLPVEQIDSDTLDAIPTKRRYRIRDMLLTLWAIVTYLADIISDWKVAVGLYQDEDYVWFGLTVTFIVVPHLTMTCFSLAWYIQDHRNGPSSRQVKSWKGWLARIVILALQLAPVMRYVDSLRFGYRFRKSSRQPDHHELYLSLCYENADAAMLRLIEAFMEAAPQLILQIYILVRKRIEMEKMDALQIWHIICAVLSWCSLATAMASFHRAQRYSQSSKKPISILGTILQFFWHLFVVASRVLAIAFFTSHFTYYGPVFCGIHVLLMLIWVLWLRTAFCPNKILEFFYNVAVACVYLFEYLNVKDSPTRRRYIPYYTLYYLENVILIVLWFVYTAEEAFWFRVPVLVVVLVIFWPGLFFMMLYYKLLHPDQGVLLKKRKSIYNIDPADDPQNPCSRCMKNVVEFCL